MIVKNYTVPGAAVNRVLAKDTSRLQRKKLKKRERTRFGERETKESCRVLYRRRFVAEKENGKLPPMFPFFNTV